jgi:EmrB/QacA subfamily drug resistance transporter
MGDIDRVPYPEPKNVAPIMFGLMLSLSLANLDQTIIATCLPAIAHDLQGWSLLPWVISAYLVTSTATTPIYGRLSDHYGRRSVILAAIAIFVVSSIFCAMATTMGMLIAARALQGLGGGGLRAVSQIVIADIIPPRYRGRYQGYMSTTFLLSTTLGPILGGFFVQHLSWQWSFWINLPLGAVAFLVVGRQLRNLKIPTRPHKIDWVGAFLVLAAAVPLMIGLSRVEQAGGWLNWEVAFPVALGIVAAVALIIFELRVAEPMLPMWLFANRVFSVGNIALFAPSMVMTALIIIMPLYYQIVLKWSAEDAGFRLIAYTGGLATGGFIVGSLVSRLGRAKIFPLIGGLLAAALCLLIAHEGLGRSALFDFICTGLLGASTGFQLNPLNVIVQNGLEIRDLGSGIGGMTFFRSLGGAFGVAAFMTFLVGRLSAGAVLVPGHEKLGADPGIGLLRQDAASAFDPAQWAAFTGVLEHAFSLVFILAAAISLAAFFAVLTINERPLRTGSGKL